MIILFLWPRSRRLLVTRPIDFVLRLWPFYLLFLGLRLTLGSRSQVTWHRLVTQTLLSLRKSPPVMGLIFKEKLVDFRTNQSWLRPINGLGPRRVLLPRYLQNILAKLFRNSLLRLRDSLFCKLLRRSWSWFVVRTESSCWKNPTFICMRYHIRLLIAQIGHLTLIARTRNGPRHLSALFLLIFSLPWLRAPKSLCTLF